MWNFVGSVNRYVLALMEGVVDRSALGKIYNDLPRQKLVELSHDRLGRVLYSPELNMFWKAGVPKMRELHSMEFGLDTEGFVVPGNIATETTLESGLKMCKRAPYGARKFVKTL